MNNEKTISKLRQKFNDRILDSQVDQTDSYGDLVLWVDSAAYLEIVRFLKEDEELHFDMLENITVVDYLGKDKRFQVVTILFSIPHNLRVILKQDIGEHESVDSLVSIYSAANWPEREAHDFFGVQFKGHPDLTRIMNVENFEGYPLRKDYPIRGKRDALYQHYKKSWSLN